MLLFTPRSILSSLVTAALLQLSPSFANPIESTDSTLAERATKVGCAGTAAAGVVACCYVDRIDADTARYRITLADTQKDNSNYVYGWCRFYPDSAVAPIIVYNRAGKGSSVEFSYGYNHPKAITGFKAYGCVNGQGGDKCYSSRLMSY